MAGLLRLVAVALSVVLLSAAAAWAQNDLAASPQQRQTARGQERAVFGGGVGSADQVLSANSNVGATYFQTLNDGGSQDAFGVRLPDKNWFGHGSAFLAYRLGLKFLSVDAAAGAFSYYFPSQKRWLRNDLSYVDATAAHSWQVTPRTQFSLNGSAALQPGFGAVVPGQFQNSFSSADPSLILPPEVTSLGGHAFTTTTGASISHSLTRRLSLDASYDVVDRMLFGRPQDFDLFQQSTFGGAHFAVTRHLSVRGGYRMYDTRQGDPGSPHERTQSAEGSVDYNRGGTLRLSRKTTLSFNGGLGALRDTSERQRYFFLGGAQLAHEMGRTWASNVGYSRTLDYSSLFREPVLSDNVTGSLNGLINSRLSFQSMGIYSRGAVGLLGAGHSFDWAAASAGLQAAVTRYLALGANYTYYYRSIGDQVTVPSDLSRSAEDQAIHVYLSTWVPLFTRTRRPNATR